MGRRQRCLVTSLTSDFLCLGAEAGGVSIEVFRPFFSRKGRKRVGRVGETLSFVPGYAASYFQHCVIARSSFDNVYVDSLSTLSTMSCLKERTGRFWISRLGMGKWNSTVMTFLSGVTVMAFLMSWCRPELISADIEAMKSQSLNTACRTSRRSRDLS